MIDLYYWPTPNGWKVSIALEEMGLPYHVIPVDIGRGEQFEASFLALSPNGRMPAIVDREPEGGGPPIPVFESGAILIYLAEKSGQFLPRAPAARYQTLQWLMFQMGGVGPMFGQVGFFHKFAGRDYQDKRPRDRYIAEAQRLLRVLDARLAAGNWLLGETYTIADMAAFPWVRNLIGFYGAGDLVGMGDFPHVTRALATFVARPAVARGLTIPARPR